MPKSLQSLISKIRRPGVGAAGVFQSLLIKSGNTVWAEGVFGHVSYLLIATVVLILSLPLYRKTFVNVSGVAYVLAAYFLYVLFLEIASRAFKPSYDRLVFRVCRICVNLILVTALVWFSAGENSYFWFFYSLPIFQAVIYLRANGVLALNAIVIAAYWITSIATGDRFNEPVDFVLLIMNSLVLSVLSFTFYWLFGSAMESRQLEYHELEALRRTSLDITAHLDQHHLFQMIIQRGVELLHASGGGIYIYDGLQDDWQLLSEWNADQNDNGRKIKIDKVILSQVMRSEKPRVFSEGDSNPGRENGHYPPSSVLVPLQSQEDKIGVLYISDDRVDRVFNSHDAHLLYLFATHAAVSIKNAQKVDRINRSVTQLEVLYQLNEKISSALSLEDVLKISLKEALRAVRVDEGSIMYLDPATDKLEIRAWITNGEFRRELPQKRLALHEGIAGQVAATGEIYNCKDANEDVNFIPTFTERNIRSILSAPIISNGRVMFVINADSLLPNFFNEDDAQFLSALAAFIAVASGPQMLRDVGLPFSTLSLNDLLSKLVESACLLTATEASTIILIDEQSGDLVRAAQFPLNRKSSPGPRSKGGLTQSIINNGEPIVVTEAQQDPRVKQEVKGTGIKSLMGVPLKLYVAKNGGDKFKTIGVLWVNSTKHRKFLRRDLTLLQILANQATIALENARLFEQTHRRALALEDLYKAALDLSSQQIPQIVNYIIERAVTMLQASGGAIYLLDPAGDKVKISGLYNLPSVFRGMLLPLSPGVVGQVIKKKASLIIPDYRNWPDRLPHFDDLNLSAVAATPITWQEQVYGAIAVHHDTAGKTFNQEDLALLSHLGSLAAVAMENARRTELLNRIMGSVFDAIITVDELGRITKFNTQAEKILEYAAEDLHEKDVRMIYAEGEAQRIKWLLLNSEDGRIIDEKTVVISKKKERIPILLSASLLFDYEGNRVGSVGFFRDLREITRANRQVQLLECLLTASQVRVDSQHNLVNALRTIANEALKALDDLQGEYKGAITLYLCDPATGEAKTPPVNVGVQRTDIWDRPVRDDSPVKKILQVGELQFIEDASAPGSITAGEFVIREGIKSCVAAPLEGTEGIIGVMFLNYRVPHHFDEEEQAIIRLFIRQAGTVIENARLFEQFQTLQKVCVSLTASLDLNSVLDEVVQAVFHLTDADEGSLLLYDGKEFTAALTSSGKGKPLEPYITQAKPPEDLAYRILAEKKPAIIPDTLKDERVNPLAIEKGRRAILGVPVLGRHNVIGVLYANWKTPRRFSKETVDLLTALASESAIAIENARLYQETKLRAEQLESLRHTSLAVTSTLDDQNPLYTILGEAVKLLKAKSGGIYEYFDERGELTLIADFKRPYNVNKILKLGEGMAGRLVQSGKPFMIVDDYNTWPDRASIYNDQEPFGAILEVPLKWRDQIIGVLYIENKVGYKFTDQDIHLLSFFADHAAIALVNSDLMRQSAEQKDRLVRLVDNSPIGIIGNDAQGYITEFNRAAQAILEYSAEEVMSNAIASLYYDRTEPYKIGAMLDSSSEGKLTGYETFLRTKSGAQVPARLSVTWLYDANRERIGAVGFFEDLRSMKEFERRVGLLLKIAGDVAKQRTLAKGLQYLAEMIVMLLSTTFCRILLLDESESFLVVKAVYPGATSSGDFSWEPNLERRIAISKWAGLPSLLNQGKVQILKWSNEKERPVLDRFSRFLGLEKNIQSLLLVPLRIDNNTVGLLDLGELSEEESSAFTDEKIEFAAAIAAQTAVLIARMQLYEATERRRQKLETLDKASRHVRAEKEPFKLWQEIVQLAAGLVSCVSGGIYIENSITKVLELKWPYGAANDLAPRKLNGTQNLINVVVETGRGQAVSSYFRSNELKNIPLIETFNFASMAAVPLKRASELEAVLFVGDRTGEKEFTASDLEILERFAEQASIALQTSSLMNREQRTFRQLTILHKISDYIQENASDDLNKILQVVLTGITANYGLGFNRAMLFLIDEFKGLEGTIGIGHIEEQEARDDWEVIAQNPNVDFSDYLQWLNDDILSPTPLNERVIALKLPIKEETPDKLSQTVKAGRPALINSDELEQLPASFIQAIKPTSPVIAVPLLVRDEVIGIIVADNKFTRTEITDEDVYSLMTFANTAAIAIYNFRLLNEAESAKESLVLCYKSSNSLVSSQPPEQVLQDIVERMSAAAGAAWVMMILLDDLGSVRKIFDTGESKKVDADVIRPDGITMQVIRTGESQVIEDIEREKEINKDRVNPILFGQGFGAAMCLPIVLREKHIGVMWLHYSKPRRFPDYEKVAFQLYVNQAAMAYDSARQLEEMEGMRGAIGELSNAADTQQVLQQIVKSAQKVLRVDAAIIWYYEATKNKFLENWEAVGLPEPVRDGLRSMVPKPEGTAAKIIEEEFVTVADVRDVQQNWILGKTTRNLLNQIEARSFVGIALKVMDESLGVLYLAYNVIRNFSDRDQRAISTFAKHAALALKKAKLLDQVNKARDTARLVAKVTTLENLDDTLKELVVGTLNALGCDIVCLYVYDEDKGEFLCPATIVGASKVYGEAELPKNSIIYKILERDDIYPAPYTLNDPLFRFSSFAKQEKVKSCAAIPLKAGLKRAGVMFVNYKSNHNFTPDDLTNIELFSNQAAVAIRNAQLYESVRKRAVALEALYKASNALTSSLQLDEILNRIAEQAWQLASQHGKQSGYASIVLIDKGNTKLAAAYPQQKDFPIGKIIETGVTGRAIETGEPQLVDDTKKDRDYIQLHPETLSELAVPMKISGEIIGVIDVERDYIRAFDLDDQRTFESLAAQAAVAIENARSFDDLKSIKGFIGSQTAIDWIKMVSAVWGHSISRDAAMAMDQLDLVRKLLSSRELGEELNKKLGDLETTIKSIMDIPILGPFSSDDRVSSLKVNETIRTYLDRKWTHDRYKAVSLSYVLQEDIDNMATVRASREWLRRAFEILIENALDAMLAMEISEKRLKVTTHLFETQDAGKVIEVSFIDNGPGISENVMGKLFKEPIDKIAGDRGTGLGLLLAQTIIQNYKGHIHVRSTGGEGTNVVVTLPVERVKSQDTNPVLKDDS